MKQEGDWCAIEFQDPQYGRRGGYIQTKFVEVRLERLQPVDLSVVPEPAAPSRPAPQRPAPQRLPAEPRRPDPQPRPVPAEPTDNPPPRPRRVRGWLNIDAARLQSRQDVLTLTATTPLFSETAAVGASYGRIGDTTDLGLSGGVEGAPGLGFHVHFSGVNYEGTVGLAIIIPSPYFFNTTALDAKPTANTLKRSDRGVDFSLLYSVPLTERVTVRVFGGPTYFYVSNEMVDDIRYTQLASPIFRVNAVSITSYTKQEVTGSSLGWNTGLDAAFFFTRRLGVGGGVRVNRGTVTVKDPLTLKDADLAMGMVEGSAGLRLRF